MISNSLALRTGCRGSGCEVCEVPLKLKDERKKGDGLGTAIMKVPDKEHDRGASIVINDYRGQIIN